MIRKEVYTHTGDKVITLSHGQSGSQVLNITGLTSASYSKLHTGSTVSPTITVVLTRYGNNGGGAPNVAVTYTLYAAPTGAGSSTSIYSFTVPARGTLASDSATVTIPYTLHRQISNIQFTLGRNQNGFPGTGQVRIKSIVITYSTGNQTVTAGNVIQDTDIGAISGDTSFPKPNEGTVISKTPLTTYGTLSGLSSSVIKASEWNSATVTKSYSLTM